MLWDNKGIEYLLRKNIKYEIITSNDIIFKQNYLICHMIGGNSVRSQYDICVFMSTYNGDAYLKEQIDSILKQERVNVNLFIRDDGSSDKTRKILNEYSSYKNINIIYGENLGYERSFMMLASQSENIYDYYLFSDQDDVWYKDKIINAINKIANINSPVLYVGNPKYVNASLNEISVKGGMLDRIPEGILKSKWIISTGLCGLGCTMLWNKKLNSIFLNNKDCFVNCHFAHDNFFSILAATCGVIYKDRDTYILYRQHDTNVSGNKLKNNSKFRLFQKISTFVQKNDYDYRLRKYIYINYNEFMTRNCKKEVELSLWYKEKNMNKLKLLKENFALGLGKHEEIKFFLFVIINKF